MESFGPSSNDGLRYLTLLGVVRSPLSLTRLLLTPDLDPDPVPDFDAVPVTVALTLTSSTLTP